MGRRMALHKTKYIMDNEELAEAIRAAHIMVKETCGKGDHYEKTKELLFELIDIQIHRAGALKIIE
jgi:hypothetical protein